VTSVTSTSIGGLKTPAPDREPASPSQSPRVESVITQLSEPAKIYALHNLKHRAAAHETPDAIVRVPNDLDVKTAIRLVIYNHGFGTNVQSIYTDSHLGEQMRTAKSNTVLVLPEWQAQADSRKGFQGNFSEPGMFRNMLSEILSLIPELRDRKLADVSDIYIAAHSAGYGPTISEIYKNGLNRKIRSIALLDALYTDSGFDNWILSNLTALRSGKKQFYNVFFDSTKNNSKQQAAFVQKLLQSDKSQNSPLLLDYSETDRVLSADGLRGKSVAFIYSTKSIDGLDQHFAIPRLYFGTLLEASQRFNK
jgi:hypothetical protein